MPKQKKFKFLLILEKYLYMTVQISEATSDSVLKKATYFMASLHYSRVKQGLISLGNYCNSHMKAKKDPRSTLKHQIRKKALGFS